MSEYIAVGSIIKPHGIKGEIVVRFFNPDFIFNEQLIKTKELMLYVSDSGNYTEKAAGVGFNRINIGNHQENCKDCKDDSANIFSNVLKSKTGYMPLFIEGIKKGNKQYFIKIENINSIEDAEKFRNAKVFTKKEQLRLEENEYLVSDLIGLKCLNILNQDLGSVTEIYQGDTDIAEIQSKDALYFLPMTDDNIQEIDIKNKVIIVKNENLYKI
ncbi:MAG: 16S rRNA processing protein RimM [Candidatus Acididesulfobacter guangdongensis]|uniref:Ribosome maturation factor RimM n=1 Tax=Acididesulfobacter guangdongensis TaxID=2597225 RepID=A0A519BJ33_ACIG2|nr:MAG: 16S rRNA processing protein RimM [Candidatus Acididesulfobacter guangdongensis]